jgi:hypothetical protein
MVWTKKHDMITWRNNEQFGLEEALHLQDTRLNHFETSKN